MRCHSVHIGCGALLLLIGFVTAASGQAPAGEAFRFTSHQGAVNRVAVSADGSLLATAGADKFVYVLETEKFKTVRKYGPHAGALTGVSILKDKSILVSMVASPTERATVVLWDWNTQAISKRVGDTDMATYGVVGSPDGDSFLVTLGDSNCRLYTLANNDRLGLVSPKDTLKCQVAIFSPNGRFIRMGSGGGATRWELGAQVRPAGYIPGENDALTTGLAYLPDGAHLLSSHADGAVRIWKDEEGTLVARIPAHKGEVTCLAVSSDGKYLATGGADKVVRVWLVTNQKLAKEFTGHEGGVLSVAFLKSGQVASTSQDGTVRVWSLEGNEVATTNTPSPMRPVPARPAEPKGLPLPEESQITAAVELVRTVFKDEYAVKKPTDKLKLADKLLTQAREETSQPAERAALCQEALRLAIEAGNVDATTKVARLSAETFRQPPDYFLQIVKRLFENVQSSTENAELASTALAWAEDDRGRERFDEADQLTKLAARAATKGRSTSLQKTAKDLNERIRREQDRFVAYQGAAKVLQDRPLDPSANLAVGRYFCISRGDWATGINHLALGSGKLREVAERELTVNATTSAADRVTLAEQWEAAAASLTESDRSLAQAAAVYWYEKALPSLAGLQKLKVEQAIKKIGTVGVQRK